MVRRSKLVVLGLAAAFALVVVGFVLVQQITTTSAAATEELKLTVKVPTGVCVGEKCTLDPGQAFTLSVEIVKAPADGYFVVQSFIDYGTDLAYTSRTEVEEIDAGINCGLLRLGIDNPPTRSHSCASGAFPIPAINNYVGQFVDLQMTCSAGASSTVVSLEPLGSTLAGDNGAGFQLSDGFSFLELSDTLTINCGAGAAETETPTGPTATPTLTGTPGPATDTPAPAPPTNTPPPPPPTATPPDIILGDTDCNGAVNSLDALWVLWLVAQLVDELPCPEVADVNGDGMVDAVDALWILWIEADLI